MSNCLSSSGQYIAHENRPFCWGLLARLELDDWWWRSVASLGQLRLVSTSSRSSDRHPVHGFQELYIIFSCVGTCSARLLTSLTHIHMPVVQGTSILLLFLYLVLTIIELSHYISIHSSGRGAGACSRYTNETSYSSMMNLTGT